MAIHVHLQDLRIEAPQMSNLAQETLGNSGLPYLCRHDIFTRSIWFVLLFMKSNFMLIRATTSPSVMFSSVAQLHPFSSITNSAASPVLAKLPSSAEYSENHKAWTLAATSGCWTLRSPRTRSQSPGGLHTQELYRNFQALNWTCLRSPKLGKQNDSSSLMRAWDTATARIT